MNRGQKAIVWSVVVAILSYILMKIMYVIDPISSDTGLLTAIVFMFVNFPMWILSGLVFIYGLFYIIRNKKKASLNEAEDIHDSFEIQDDEEK